MDEISLSERNKANKLEALDLADKIYKVITTEEFRENVKDPDVRYNMIRSKYPNFAQAYPIILRWMARDYKYKREAFEKFLDKLEKDPGKGMEGFIERQADYSMFLYLEENKKNHASLKKAYELKQIEINNMNKWHKKIKKEEESARNEFEEEKEKNLVEKRSELLNFINTVSPVMDNEKDTIREDAERLKLGLPLKNPNPTFHDIDITNFNKEEISLLIREMRIYEQELQETLKKKDEYIAFLEEKKKAETYVPIIVNEDDILEDEWLKDTSVSTMIKLKRKNKKKNGKKNKRKNQK